MLTLVQHYFTNKPTFQTSNFNKLKYTVVIERDVRIFLILIYFINTICIILPVDKLYSEIDVSIKDRAYIDSNVIMFDVG